MIAITLLLLYLVREIGFNLKKLVLARRHTYFPAKKGSPYGHKIKRVKEIFSKAISLITCQSLILQPIKMINVFPFSNSS